jgi:cation:H+ antiporter
MLGASLLVVPLLWDGSLGRGEGAVLVVGALVVTAVLGWCGSGGDGDDEGMPTASFGLVGPRALLANIVALVAGVALLGLGSSWLVHGAVGLAAGLGVSETVIGLTIVAAGTSTPELVTSLVAARNGRDDIAIANVIGSNLFNLLGILGLTALVTPLAVPARILTRDLWWMIGLAALLLPMLWRPRLRRVQGLVLLAVFVAYLGLLVWEVS